MCGVVKTSVQHYPTEAGSGSGRGGLACRTPGGTLPAWTRDHPLTPQGMPVGPHGQLVPGPNWTLKCNSQTGTGITPQSPPSLTPPLPQEVCKDRLSSFKACR